MAIEVRSSEISNAKTRQMIHPLNTLQRSIFWISLPFGVLGFVLPIYGKEIGAGAAQIGLFFSGFFLMTVLIRPVVGAGVDSFGRRPFFIAGLFGYSLSMFVFAFSNQVWMIVLGRMIQGTASALMWLSAQAITADAAGEEQRGRIFGILAQSNSRGAILGAFIGFGLLISTGFDQSWRWLFTGYGLAGLATAFWCWHHLPETNSTGPRTLEQPIQWSRTWGMLLLVSAVTAAGWTMVEPMLMIFLQEKMEAPVDLLALAYLPSALVWALLPSRLGRLADRFGRKPLMLLGTGMAAVASFVLPSLTSLLWLAVIWALQALCYAAGDPAEQALVADLTGGDQRGRAYSLYATASGLGAAIGPLAGGWMYDRLGSGAPFYANGLILVVCSAALLFFIKEPTQST